MHAATTTTACLLWRRRERRRSAVVLAPTPRRRWRKRSGRAAHARRRRGIAVLRHRLRLLRWLRRRHRALIPTLIPTIRITRIATLNGRRVGGALLRGIAPLTCVLLHRLVDEVVDAAFQLACHLLERLPQDVAALEHARAFLIRIAAQVALTSPDGNYR